MSIFCEIDDFCKELADYRKHKLLGSSPHGERGPECSLSLSEIMTILVMFQRIQFKNFKTFYTGFRGEYWRVYFPQMPSYPRFVELMKRALFPLTLFAQMSSGKRTGIYYIDSSCLPVCHLARKRRHKVFNSVAEFGRTSLGWFFGLKLHLVINEQGELMAFRITRGNYNDSKMASPFLKLFQGLAFGDKGYISKKVFDELMKGGLKLITRKRKNMKNTPLLSTFEKQLLNQRNLIETVINHLKHHFQVWHTRHRSITNALTHLVAALAAYAIEPLKLAAIKLIAQQNQNLKMTCLLKLNP